MEVLKDLVLEKDTVIYGNLHCLNIFCKGGVWNLKVNGNINAEDINARDINAGDINAKDINAKDINARDIDAWDINAWDINAGNINARDISFYAICIAYHSFKCITAKARRDNHVLKCLDEEIEYVKEHVHEYECSCGEKQK